MNTRIQIAVAAGLAATVMYASGASGPLPVMVLLNILTPLPLMLAGLGWGAQAGLIAAVAGSLSLALIIAPKLAIVFALTYAMPAALLTFLALLHRAQQPAGNGPIAQGTADWFPVGRILAIAAALACLFSLAAVRLLGADAPSRRAAIRTFLDKGFFEQFQTVTGRTLGAAEAEEFVTVFDYAIPASTAISWLLLMLFNLWLAGRITLASGRLIRPWPDLGALRLPALFPFIFAGLVGLLFLADPIPVLVSGPLGAFLLVYLLVGLAVLHTITRRFPLRGMVLGAAYAGMVVLPQVFPVLAVLIGLGEPMLRLRERLRPPSSLPPVPPVTPI